VFTLLIGLLAAGCGANPPTVERVGGTVLVYEVDSERRPAEYQPQALTDAVKRRLDPSGVSGIAVRPLEKGRIEIQIPRAHDHEEHVARLKNLLAQTGLLEFRIVANDADDQDAIDEARQQFARAANDTGAREKLERLAMEGLPPPPLQQPTRGGFTYTWVELAPSQQRTMNLDNAAAYDPERGQMWQQVAAARQSGIALYVAGRGLIYSRACKDQLLPESVRGLKRFDYFTLCRDPALDRRTKESLAVTGLFLDKVAASSDSNGKPALAFHFNKQGADRFLELTSQNLPSCPADAKVYRHLAIILDGMIMSAPTINSAIGADGQITGDFSQQKVDQLVELLRAGVLPVPLKPVPFSETTVAPSRP
jgi:preprotein translocase subunit SecD